MSSVVSVEEKIQQKEYQKKIERKLCPECKTGRKQSQWNWKVVAFPVQGETQQDGMQTGVPKSTVKGKDKQRDIRRIFKILREVQLNIGVEKVNTHEGITVKVLLDSGVTGMFMDRKMAAKHGFRLQKLKRPVTVRNVDKTNNSGRAIIHQVEVNVYYKSYVKRIRIDIYDLEKTNIILGMLQLQAYDLEIN